MLSEKTRKAIFIVISAFMLAAPALTTDIKRNQISEMDNRQLYEFPELKMGGFRSSLENYLSDRVGFRDRLITFYQVFCDRAFHVLEHPFYVYGKDGHVMTMWDLTTYQNRDVSQEYVDNLAGYLKSISNFCKSRGSMFLFYLCPNKETIYPEFCPDGYNINSQLGRTEQILEKLEVNGVPYLYPKDLFMKLKDTEQIYNKKYDAGHWNMKGTFYGQKEAVAYLNRMFPAMGELEETEFLVGTEQMDYLISSRFHIDEPVPTYTIKETEAEEEPEIFEKLVLADANMYHTYFRSKVQSEVKKPRILIFGDSYFGGVAPFYLNHCSELLLLHSNNMVNADYYISIYQPDIIIYEAVERVLQKEGTLDDVRISKKLCTLENYEQQQYKIEELRIEEEILVFDKNSRDSEYVTFEGNVGDTVADGKTVAVAAVVNEREYFSVFNESSGVFQFTFRKTDLLAGVNIDFYRIYDSDY